MEDRQPATDIARDTDAASVAALVARTCLAANPLARPAAAPAAEPTPSFAEAPSHDRQDLQGPDSARYVILAVSLVLFALVRDHM